MADRKARLAKLEELKRARSGEGSRSKEYKEARSNKIYDEVDDEEYRTVVRARLDEDDFIEDDGCEGYIDNGEDDWDRRRRGSDEDEDDEDDSDGGVRKKKKGKKAATGKNGKENGNGPAAGSAAAGKAPNGKAKKPLPPPRPILANPYKKEISAAKEDDFMADVLGDLDAAPRPISPPLKKRKALASSAQFSSTGSLNGLRSSHAASSSSLMSSDPVTGPESSQYAGDTGPSSDGLFDVDADTSRTSKKARVSGAEDKLDSLALDLGLENDDFNNTFDGDDMAMELFPEMREKDKKAASAAKAGAEDDEDDEMQVKQVKKAKSGGKRQQLVNSTSMKVKPPLEPVVKAQELDEYKPASLDIKPVTTLQDKKKDRGMDWQLAAAQVTLEGDENGDAPMPGSEDVDIFSAAPTARSTKKIKAPSAGGGSLKTAKVQALEEDGSVRFYWLDYVETNGVLHFIGKVFDKETKKYVSCCVTVEGIDRNLFVLPRQSMSDEYGNELDPPTEEEVYDDFGEVASKAGIKDWIGSHVQRKYAFELPDVPQGEASYMKVLYSYDQPQLPFNCSGKTFSRVFGTNTSAFELFVLKRKIMGPCWLNIQEPEFSDKAISWCKLEINVSDPKTVKPFSENDESAPKDMPPLTVMSLSARSIVNHQANKKEIVSTCARVWQDMNIDDPTPIERQPCTVHTSVRPLLDAYPAGFDVLAKSQKSKILMAQNERHLLNHLLLIIQKVDPDVIVGHEFSSVLLDVLLHRLRDLKADHYSRIGRFRRMKWPRLRAGMNSGLLSGRLVCDLASEGSKSMIQSTTWSLTEMCQSILKIDREDIDPDDTPDYFDKYAPPTKLLHFIRHCEADSYFQMALAFKVQLLPLTKQLCNLAGNSWSKTLNGGRAERNEYILLHEFHRQKYVCPDKISRWERMQIARTAAADPEDDEGGMGQAGDEAEAKGTAAGTGKKGTAKKDKYKGGLVFDPKRGLWDKYVLVMDFNSLYPSIIQEFNIDFTTIERHSGGGEADEAGDEVDKIPEIPGSDVKQGVLPRLIATLVNRRKQVKSLMKDRSASQAKQLQWDIKQKALKLTANSMYGCLGFEGSRFYARPLAALTTFKGREILTNTKELAESLQLDVIYGDTDSVMINTNASELKEATQTGNEFKKLVNDRYRLLEIDIDAIFQRMLLLQKKKYAALKIEDSGESTMEIKGLDMKRREFCPLSKTVSGYVLKQILSGEATEHVVEHVHDYLESIGKRVRAGEIDLDEFIILKRLGKNPQDYPDAKSQPHVQVALRMQAKGQTIKAGDVIPYVFCLAEDGITAKSAKADRAFHPDDLRKKDTTLKIDYDFYLSLQVLPPTERLCDPIEGTERARLAECLGLDPNRFRTQQTSIESEREFHSFESQISDAQRFALCEPLNLRCRACKHEQTFGGLLENSNGMLIGSGLHCTKIDCAAWLSPASVQIQVENQVRAAISRFYESWLVCDDQSCGNRTRMLGMVGRRCLKPECRGKMHNEYSDSRLYNQMLYFQSLFDTENARSKTLGTPRAEEIQALAAQYKESFLQISASIEDYMKRCGRRYVSLESVFSYMKVAQAPLA